MLFLHRNKILFRIVISYIILSFLFQTFFPMGVYALTSGPAQPEFSSFEPAGTSEMVNLSTGDFNYNINLMDVSGFPVNISYHGGHGQDTESGMVGLGWNLNIGQLNRSMRGLPDEFDGDEVKKKNFVKPNNTFGLNASTGWELGGFELDKIVKGLGLKSGLTVGLGVFYNNYRGMGFEFTANVKLSPSKTSSTEKTRSLNGSLMSSFNTQNGLTIAPSIGLSATIEESKGIMNGLTSSIGISDNANLKAAISSRQGLQRMSISGSRGVSNQISHYPTGLILDSQSRGTRNGGASISFSTPSYTPELKLPFGNIGQHFSFKSGPEFVANFPHIPLSGYFSSQFLVDKEESIPAYGFFNQSKVMDLGEERLLMDFNRHKDGSYIPGTTPNLPVPQATYDVYSAVGHGIAGSYRPYHSGIYDYSDPNSHNLPVDGIDVSTGLEPGLGNTAHVGGNFAITLTTSKSGKWKDNNKLEVALNNGPISSNKHAYEPFYFKNLGEKSVESELSFYNKIGNEEAVYVPIEKKNHHANNTFKDEAGNTYNAQNYHRNVRAKRNQHLSFLTRDEVKKIGKKEATDYTMFYSESNSHPSFTNTPSGTNPGNNYRKDHHPSEFRAINPDGTSYIYGLPAYNISELQKTFALPENSELTGTCSEEQFAEYNVGNSEIGGKGISKSDKLFESIETPAYAHTYLLTEVHSPDYVDLESDGITTDDPGSAYKVNYSRLRDKNSGLIQNYRWRTPLLSETQQANLSEGIKADPTDDKASYVYGEREQWYVNSIESKDRIAIFFYSDREDGIGVKNEHGALDDLIRLKKLDRIELYPRDRLSGAQAPGLSSPIKTVHFKYDYELCGNVPNNMQTASGDVDGNGKLTLKELWFTYGNSQRDRLNPYVFDYSSFNPDYEYKAYDRWGNYSPTKCGDPLQPWDYPYVDQRDLPNTHADYDDTYPEQDPKRYADQYVDAWQLSAIKTPSGARIEIDYEADDYAYVQDKWAHQMVKVLGAGSSSDKASMTSTLFEKKSPSISNFINHNFLFLELPKEVDDKADFEKKYLKGLWNNENKVHDLYFNFSMDALTNSPESDFERIGGFVEIENFGWINDHEVWLKIGERGKKDKDKGKMVPHIAKIAWNHIRLYMSKYMYPSSSPLEPTPLFFQNLIGFAIEMQSFIAGPYTMMQTRGFAQKFDPERSWVRLSSPDGFKHGGGLRVKKIKMFDNWDQMSGGAEESYGQVYDYTIKDDDDEERKISSGVASYEPVVGDDENPFYKQKSFEAKKTWFPDDVYSLPDPILQPFFPSPSVVYSQVQVRDLNKLGVDAHKRGYTESQYYTAKDFPVITQETKIEEKTVAPDFNKLFNLKDYVSVSQGYAVKLNNMHGMPKAQWVYAEGKETEISGVEYKYRTKTVETQDGEKQVLDNDLVPVIHKTASPGIIAKQTIGREIDFVLDSRQHNTKTIGVGASLNMDGFFLGIFPGLVISGFPFSLNENRRFRSLVTMKTVHHSGLLSEVIAHDGNAHVSTFNEAYDAETGEVLLTKTRTEYDTYNASNNTGTVDEVYAFNYPAHWSYDQMGQAYINQGMHWEEAIDLDDFPYVEHFVKGDKLLLIEENGDPKMGWVLDMDVAGDKLTIVDNEGELLPPTPTANTSYTYLKIIESGRSNQQAISVGSVVSKENPIPENPSPSDRLSFNKVLAASAVEFSDEWQMQCGPPPTLTKCGCTAVSNEAQDLEVLLDNLLVTGQLLGQSVDLSTNPDFTPALAEAAIPNPSTGCTPMLQTTMPGTNNNCSVSQLIIEIGESCNGNFTETTTITLDAPQDNILCLEGMTDFFRIHPTEAPATNPNCEGSNDFTMIGYYDFCAPGDNESVLFQGNISSFPVRECSTYVEFLALCAEEGEVINPYLTGIRGNWAPVQTYSYLTGRTFSANANQAEPEPLMATDLKEQGIMQEFSPFWNYSNANETWEVDNSQWRSTSTLTKRLPQGLDIESVDALGNYSSVQYGQYLRLPVAVAANARINEIAYASFEFGEDFGTKCHVHANFTGNVEFDDDNDVVVEVEELELTDELSHTGLRSVRIEPKDDLILYSALSESDNTSPANSTVPFAISNYDCAGNFKPTIDKKYRLAFWVRSDSYESNESVFSYESELSFKLKDHMQNNTNAGGGGDNGWKIDDLEINYGKLVDGWMPVEIIFEIADHNDAGIHHFRLKIENDNNKNSGIRIFIDDLVIHPIDANVQTWVYDPETQWLLASGDANNYYKIYQYDKSGSLTSVKQESENGIITTQSANSHMANQKN